MGKARFSCLARCSLEGDLGLDGSVDKKSGNLISGGEDMNLFTWNVEYERVIRNLRGHRSGISCLAVHPSLNLLASGSRDNTIRIWDLRMKKEVSVIKYHKNQISSVLFNHESPHLISSSQDSKICLWDMVSFRCTNCLIIHSHGIKDVKLHPTELKFGSLCSFSLNLWRLDGFIVKMSKKIGNVALFCFKNLNEMVTIENSGWTKFYRWDCKKNSLEFNYGFFSFTQKTSFPTTIEMNSEYNVFIACNNAGEMVLFKNKWWIKNKKKSLI